ncbi:MAG: methyltransferase domain-containing protein [Chloroflexi bacterium]|nr:methyltransferase domain-containing protein [Chloroflexota bacterium]MYF65806.1 methyltransferase domain-containing protein [Chloroflexota bacterium]MYK34129.1 methyltransferase domain-containing protein [Chloroflexota bacterium]
MTTGTEQHHEHDWQSREYVDYWIGRDVTRDDERREHLLRMAALLPYEPDAEIRVLDVGAGYGAVSQAVLDMFPNAHVVLHDFSAPMLEHARERLERYESRTSQVMADLADPAWTQAVGGPVDGVVSGIAIHNLREPELIARVYADVFTLVKPGGAFLNWELIQQGDTSRAANTRAALVMKQRSLFEETGVRPSLEELAAERERRRPSGGVGRRARRSRPTLMDHLGWLRAAGFDEAECFWRDGSNALIGGYRLSSEA